MSEETKDETTGTVEAAEEKPAEEKPAAESPAAEPAAAESPAAEPAAAESPATEPAAAETPAAEPAAAETSAAEPAAAETPAAESPAAESPVVAETPEPAEEKPSDVPDAAAAWGGEGTAEAPGPTAAEKAAQQAEDERRTAQRKGVRLNKLISASLNSGDSLYLHLVDISEGGMRVNGDLEFNQAEPFTLTLQMEAFGKDLAEEHPNLTLGCRVVWQKRLLGGMFVSGLQFVDMSDENQIVVKKILERSSPEGRRLRFRLNRVLGVGIGLDEETRWLYPLALDLSVEGMRLRLDEEIEVGSIFPLQIFLEFDLPTVRVQAEAVWREEVGNGRYQVGLRFTEVSEDSATAIQEYIDRCLAKESKV